MSPTIIVIQYFKYLANFYGLEAFIAPNMMDLVIYPEHHGKEASYHGSNIHDLYCYLEILGYPTPLTYLGHNYQSINISIDTESGSLHLVISGLIVRQRIVCECSGIPGHKAYSYIIIGDHFLPSRLCMNRNLFNAVDGGAPYKPPK